MKTKLLFSLLCFATSITYILAQDTVTLNSAIHYQTIEGWGHGGGILGGVNPPFTMLDSSIANPVNYEYLDYITDELGLTGTRTWEVGPRIDGTGMDHGDCDSIDWSCFQSNSYPPQLANYLAYFKNKVLAKGYQPNFYSSPGYPTHATDQKPWIMYHPGERAQQIWASALYLHNTYGIDMNYDVIYNEPSGNVTSTLLADDIKALGPRLISHGLSTKSQYPEAVDPQTDWDYITPVQNDSLLWTNIGRLSWHIYGTTEPYRNDIYNFGLSKGLTTSQTEMQDPSFDDLYKDLTLGMVSYWEVAFSSGNTLANDTGLTTFSPSQTFFRLRQVIHYVTPGSLRIDGATNDPNLHVLSFIKGGAITTIIENNNSGNTNVTITGLPAGTYGLSRAQMYATAFEELGLQTVGGSGTITLTLHGGSWVTTLYPYTLPNHPPDIMTFNAHPGYIVSPVTSITLTSSANDAELDQLHVQWTVVSDPAGSAPVIATPASYNTSVTGLTVPGTYVFNIGVTDGTSTTNRKVYVVAYASNPPAVLGNAGFRIAAPYGLIFSVPGDTTHANIELPTSSVTLQVQIGDLANSNFSGMGTWSIVSQPAGGVATISSSTYIYLSIRADVHGMTVPGDYVFHVNVLNPGLPDLTAQIICTVHPESLPPVINSITPAPAVMSLPASSSLLTAITSDPEGDLLRHWWMINSAPAGSNPLFDHQGRSVTTVSGLTVAGTYIFTLRCFDDLHMTTQNVTVVVNPNEAGINHDSEEGSSVLIYPNPFTSLTTISFKEYQINTIIKITDILNKEIKKISFTGRQLTIDKGEMKAGIYFVQTIDDKKNMRNRKIIVQ